MNVFLSTTKKELKVAARPVLLSENRLLLHVSQVRL